MTNTDFNNEVNITKAIVINNGSSDTIIGKMIITTWEERERRLTYPTQDSIVFTIKYFKFNYVEGTTYRIANKLKNFRTKTTCGNKNKLGPNLVNVKEKWNMNTKRVGYIALTAIIVKQFVADNVEGYLNTDE